LTNQSQQTDIERGKKLGVSGYIIKASTIPSEVVKEVDEILKNKNNN
jgi:DNA-binding NarL/FixJ family response regulator